MTEITTLADRCYAQLEEEIVLGVLHPGAKLPMAMLRKHLEAGLSPIREALSRLVHTGLVVCEGNRGFCVSTISEADVRDLFRTSAQMQALALRQAMELGDADWEARVVAALHLLAKVECADEIPAYDQWFGLNEAFHHALISGCQSPTLLKICDDLCLRSERYCRLAYDLRSNSLSVNHDEHARLVKLTLNRDVDAACQALSDHMTSALEDVIDLLKKRYRMT